MLSVVITTLNEEKNLPRVVASVRGLADEIIVVDTESTDNTIKVARELGCRVYSHKYLGIVEPVRNFSIGKAKGDWVLVLDADEEISAPLKNYIKTLISSDQADYYRIPRQNVIFGKWIRNSHWWPDFVYRLFKKGFVVWDEAIHSVPATRGRGLDLPVRSELAIIHHNYASISQFLLRMDRYTDHQLKLLLDRSTSFSWTQLLSKPIAEFVQLFFSRGGYKDGVHGLALAGLQAFSEFVVYAKLWQHQHFVDKPIPLEQLYSEVTDSANEFSWWYFQARIDTSPFYLKPIWKFLRKVLTHRFFKKKSHTR